MTIRFYTAIPMFPSQTDWTIISFLKRRCSYSNFWTFTSMILLAHIIVLLWFSLIMAQPHASAYMYTHTHTHTELCTESSNFSKDTFSKKTIPFSHLGVGWVLFLHEPKYPLHSLLWILAIVNFIILSKVPENMNKWMTKWMDSSNSI